MSRRAAAAGLLLALACLVFGYQAGRAAGPASRPTPTFTPVRIPAAVSSQPTPSVSVPGTILEPNLATLTPRVAVEQPSPELRIVEKPVGSIAAAKAHVIGAIGSRQAACLFEVVARESGWNVRAVNRSSGAYGLPQALPGSKMAAYGADWRTNPVTQLRWMVQYVSDSRYGSACEAWAFWQRNGWY